jgi:hypothetical protein
MDVKVTEYIRKQTEMQRKICNKLRKILLSLKVKEEMKMGVPWYEGRYYIYSGKHGDVNLGISVKGMKKADAEMLKGQGKFMRHLKFKDVKEIDVAEIRKILKKVGRVVAGLWER